MVRRNATLDGETIGYQFSEGDAETRRQQGGSEIKLALMKNWRDQCVAQVKGERNHPSIQIWSLDNEFVYINLINLLGNSPNMDLYEEEIAKGFDGGDGGGPDALRHERRRRRADEKHAGGAWHALSRHLGCALSRPGL